MRPLILILSLCILTSPALAAQDVASFNSPDISNPVWVLPDPSTNLIAMDMTFEGGISLDPNGKEGLVNLLGGILLSGAGDKDAQALAQYLKDHAISISINSTRDETIVSLSTPARFWPQTVNLLKEVLFKPRFDEGEIRRSKASQIASLKSDLSDPNWRAQRILNGTVYKDTSYARPGAGTPTSLQNVQSKDFKDVYKRIFDAKPVHAVFVGRVGPADMQAMLDIFDDLPAATIEPAAPDYRHLTPPAHIFHSYDVPQTSLIYVLPGLHPQDKDYAAFTVLNALLGDGFGSRLMTALREESGLSYGVSSSATDARHGALWMFSLQVEDKNTAEAAGILEDKIHSTATAPFTKKEVKLAAESLAAQLPMGWTSSNAIAGQLGAAQRDGYNPHYLEQWQASLRKVTPEDVQNVAKRLLQDPQSVMIAVGRNKPDESWTDLPQLPAMKE